MAKSYVLTSLTEDQEMQLRGAGINLCRFQLGEDIGLVFDESDLTRAKTMLGTGFREERTDYAGIFRLIPIDAATAEAIARRGLEATWHCFSGRANQGRFQDAVNEILIPVVRKNIVMHRSRDKRRTEGDGDTFVIHCFSGISEGDMECRIVDSIPAQLWGIDNPTSDAAFSYLGIGEAITDDAGYIAAELCENDLFIFHDITASSNANSLEIFKKILQEAVRMISRPPDASRTYPVFVARWNGNQQGRFVHMTKEILSPVVKKNIRLAVPHKEVQEPRENGSLNIWIWSSPLPMAGGEVRPPETMWGIPVDCRDSAFPPTFMGEVIFCDEGYAVAEFINGSNLYIFHDIAEKGTENELKIYQKILEYVLDIFASRDKELSELRGEGRERYIADQRVKYIQECSRRTSVLIKKTEEGIRGNEKRLGELQKEIVVKAREIRGAMLKLEQIRRAHGNMDEMYTIEFNKICQIPKVRHIVMRSGIIEVLTDTLCCRNPNTKLLHEIGKFNIKVFMNGDNGCVRWFNLTRMVVGYGGQEMNAPHVYGAGNACMGNTSETFPQLIATCEYAACIFLAIQFIESVNIDDGAGRHIVNWPIVDEKSLVRVS